MSLDKTAIAVALQVTDGDFLMTDGARNVTDG
jgi:hypothetical protein